MGIERCFISTQAFLKPRKYAYWIPENHPLHDLSHFLAPLHMYIQNLQLHKIYTI